MPAWLLLVVAVVVAAVFGAFLVAQARSAVDLGPAVGAAQSVDVRMTLCNRDVDRLKINPRKAELGLESQLRDVGSRAAKVVVERQDCPTNPSPPAGAP